MVSLCNMQHYVIYIYPCILHSDRARSEPGGTRWRTGGEVKGKLANGVGSQYSHATSERGISSITQADAHTSAASSRLNWHPQRFKWTRPFQGKTKSGFCACAITFRTSYTIWQIVVFLTARICEYTHNYIHCIIDLTQGGWHILRPHLDFLLCKRL